MLHDSRQQLDKQILVFFVRSGFRKLSLCTFSYGDEIIEINDMVVYNMDLNDVYSVLSQCTPGPVHIIVSRHPNPKVRKASTQTSDHYHLIDHPEKLEA